MGAITASRAWIQVCVDLTRDGQVHSPRGLETKELLGYQSVIDMNYAITDFVERKISFNFMCAEAEWIISGRNDVQSLIPYAPSYAKFSDNGQVLAGAYGPRFIQQLDYVVDSLASDVSSRQSVISIWKPNPAASKDIPCTLTAQFMIREGKLHAFVNMRSSDAYLGRPYDTFSFTCMAIAVMLELGRLHDIKVELGNLYLTAASQHIYQKHYDKVEVFSPGRLANANTLEFLGNPSSYQDLIKSLNLLKDKNYD